MRCQEVPWPAWLLPDQPGCSLALLASVWFSKLSPGAPSCSLAMAFHWPPWLPSSPCSFWLSRFSERRCESRFLGSVLAFLVGWFSQPGSSLLVLGPSVFFWPAQGCLFKSKWCWRCEICCISA